MKKIFLIRFFCSCFFFCMVMVQSGRSQNPGQWMWINGDSTLNSPGTGGTQGIPAPGNSPPAMYQCNFWTDQQGSFWLFGGLDTTYLMRNDLWKYDPAINQWAWMKGNATPGDTGNYGIIGIPSPLNNPASRSYGSPSWVDKNGNLWLFSGQTSRGNTDDLWKYDISTNEWTWIKGQSNGIINPVFGIQGVPSLSNTPGSRSEANACWTDAAGNLWLYGGQLNTGFGSDLWKYNPNTNEWTWMQGSQLPNNFPVWGIKNVPNPANTPGSVYATSKWTDSQENFWLFGGIININPNVYSYNTLWKYDVSVNQWIWKNGPNAPFQQGNLNAGYCISSAPTLPMPVYEGKACWEIGDIFFFYAGYDLLNGGMRNLLWSYDVTTDRWKLMSGNNQLAVKAKHGTLNVSSSTNQPGSRMGECSWYGGGGKLYLFGGAGLSGIAVRNNDLFVYKIDTNCVKLISTPIAAFSPSDTAFCDESGMCINFFDVSIGSPSAWKWLFPGAVPDTSTQKNPTNICYYTPGTYPVTLIVSNAAGIDTVTVSPIDLFRNSQRDIEK